MGRTGRIIPPLTEDELRTIFELVGGGRSQEEARKLLSKRSRTTVNRAFNVASIFERQGLFNLDDPSAHFVASTARYGASIHYVQGLFLRWKAWKTDSALARETEYRPQGNPGCVPESERQQIIPEGLNWSLRDPELGPHRREIFYFIVRVRDRIDVPGAVNAVEKSVGGSRRFWKGEECALKRSSALDVEEARVAKDWGYGLNNAHTHPLFPLFEEHLTGDFSLRLLEDAETAIALLVTTWEQLFRVIQSQIASELPKLSPSNLDSLVYSLLSGIEHNLVDSGKVDFSYIPIRSTVSSNKGEPPTLNLQLRAWSVNNIDDMAALNRIAEVHQNLIDMIPQEAIYERAKSARDRAQNTIMEFRQSLTPDARLRKLLLTGRCSECP